MLRRREHVIPLGLAFGLALGAVLVASRMLPEPGGPGPETADPPRAAAAETVPGAAKAIGRARAESDDTGAGRPSSADSDRELGTLKSAVAGMRRDLGAIRQEVASLASSQDAPSDWDAAGDEDREPADLDDLERAEEATRAVLHRLASRLNGERVDHRWAGEARSAIRETIAANEGAGVMMVDASCGATLCRIDLVRDGSSPAEPHPASILDLVPWPASALVHVTDGGEVVLFVAREGFDLPE